MKTQPVGAGLPGPRAPAVWTLEVAAKAACAPGGCFSRPARRPPTGPSGLQAGGFPSALLSLQACHGLSSGAPECRLLLPASPRGREAGTRQRPERLPQAGGWLERGTL